MKMFSPFAFRADEDAAAPPPPKPPPSRAKRRPRRTEAADGRDAGTTGGAGEEVGALPLASRPRPTLAGRGLLRRSPPPAAPPAARRRASAPCAARRPAASAAGSRSTAPPKPSATIRPGASGRISRGNSGGDGEIEGVAVGQVLAPLAVGAEVFQPRLHLGDGDLAARPQRHDVGAAAVRQGDLQQRRIAQRRQQPRRPARHRAGGLGPRKRSRTSVSTPHPVPSSFRSSIVRAAAAGSKRRRSAREGQVREAEAELLQASQRGCALLGGREHRLRATSARRSCRGRAHDQPAVVVGVVEDPVVLVDQAAEEAQLDLGVLAGRQHVARRRS